MQKSLGYLAILLGAVGLAACVAVLVVEWTTAARVHQATERLYSSVNNTLAGVHEKVDKVQEHVAEMNLTAGELAAGLKDRTTEEIRERLAAELKLEERAEGLSAGVTKADEMASVAEALVLFARSLVELLTAAGINVDTTGIDDLLGEVLTIRGQLADVGEQVTAFREQLHGDQEHDGQIVRFVVRAASTLAMLDERVGKFGDRITAAQDSIALAEKKSQWWITTLSILGAVLLLWLAAGQAALVYVGWIRTRGDASNPA